DDDAMADRYLIADGVLSAHGMAWYEISNWAAREEARCRHNLLYWTGGGRGGGGPGGRRPPRGTRGWGGKDPPAPAARSAAGRSPAQAREVLAERERRLERILLTTRLAGGCLLAELEPAGLAAAADAVTGGLAAEDAHASGRVVLTRRGRLLA